MKEIIPLVVMVVSIFVGVKVGEWVTKKTGRRIIGWPVGILVFLSGVMSIGLFA